MIQGIVDQAQKRKNGSEGKKVDENKTVDRGISGKGDVRARHIMQRVGYAYHAKSRLGISCKE